MVAMKRDVLACPVDPVPEMLKVDCPLSVLRLPCEMEPAGVTSFKAEESVKPEMTDLKPLSVGGIEIH